MNPDSPKPGPKPGEPDLGPPLEDGTDPVAGERVTPVVGNVTGRVKFDDRGNAVWEWAVSTGSFGTEVSSKRLQKLQHPALSISDDAAAAPANQPAGAAAPVPAAPPTPAPVKENRKGVTLGYSPYDSGLLVKAEAQRAKKKDLKRLSEWLKLREQAMRNKQNDD